MEAFEHAGFVVDRLLAKLLLQVFLLVKLTLDNVLVAVFGGYVAHFLLHFIFR